MEIIRQSGSVRGLCRSMYEKIARIRIAGLC